MTSGFIDNGHAADSDDLLDLISVVQQSAYVLIIIHCLKLLSQPELYLDQNTGDIIRRSPVLGNIQKALAAMLLADSVNYLEQHFLVTQDWGMGATIAVFLIITMFLFMALTRNRKRGTQK